jgi:hypothetical protein
VLADDAKAGQNPILLFFLPAQHAPTWLFLRGLAIAMPFLSPLIPSVGSTFYLGLYGGLAPLEKLAVVLSALADGNTEDRAGVLCDDELRFLRVALLLPTGVFALFFCGRSTGLSATSIPMTSNCVPPAYNFFFPGT